MYIIISALVPTWAPTFASQLILFFNGLHKIPLITENEETQSNMNHSIKNI